MSLKFIDLFAGLGGFHLALQELGHKCVFACEIDPQLNALYRMNFKMSTDQVALDIRDVDEFEIPEHDILCAGFPCQPFSQANHRSKGFDCPKWGDLFSHVIRILKAKKPRYFILENVPFLKNHDDGRTWQKIHSDLKEIQTDLKAEKYEINESFFSPHQFNIPQIRKRMFIIGNRSGSVQFPPLPTPTQFRLHDFLDKNPSEARKLTEQQTRSLKVWQNFLDLFPNGEKLPSVPIWSREFGATYPYEDVTPESIGTDKLREGKYLGNYGVPLENLSDNDLWENLPAYAKRGQDKFPSWKIHYIKQNREFYDTYKERIDEWVPQILNFPRSFQKFEWNCKGEKRSIEDLIIQFRGSGVRVKRPQTAPTLVVRSTQVPVIGWEERFMTPKECARLQSIKDIKLPELSNQAFNALGNAVNVDIVKCIAKALTSNSASHNIQEEQPNLFIDMESKNYE